jgi:hypothetical protein
MSNHPDPSNYTLELGGNKVVGEDKPTYQPTTQLRAKVGRIDKELVKYVAKQMRRPEITGEVIGNALLFEEEMNAEINKIEAEARR